MRSANNALAILALTLGLALGLAASPALAASPLVGEWHMDQNTGVGEGPDQTPDSSGFGRDLVADCQGCVSFPSGGRFGNYLMADDESMRTQGIRPAQVTVVAWVRRSDQGAGSGVIAGQADNDFDCSVSYGLLHSVDESGGNFGFVVRTLGGAVSSPTVPDASLLDDGEWHQLVGTFDGSHVRLYVDGTEVEGGTPSAASAISYGSTTEGFGVHGFIGSACTSGGMAIGLDEVRVYDRALTATEIARLASAPGPDPPVLEPDQTSPGGSTPPGGSSPPPAPTPPPVVRLAAPGKAEALKPFLVNASGTTGATSYLWDFNNDGNTDLRTTPEYPAIQVTIPAKKFVQIKLTAVGPGGSTSKTTPKFAVAAPPGLGKVLQASKHAATAVAAPFAVPYRGAFASSTCTQQIVAFKLIEASGCFVRSKDFDDLPPGLKTMVRNHYEAEKESPVVVWACQQEAKGTGRPGLCADAKRIFGGKALDFYVSKSAVKLSGLTIKPGGASPALVVFPSLQRVMSTNATMSWGGMTVKSGKLDLNLKNQSRFKSVGNGDWPVGSAPLLNFDGKKDLPSIGGFRLDGKVELAVEAIDGRRYSTGKISLTLPPVFKLFGSKPPNASVSLRADNAGGPALDNLDIGVPQADLGAVSLTDLRFRYSLRGGIDAHLTGTAAGDCNSKEWKAQANIFLGGKPGSGQTGLKLSPPPRQNGVGFCNGSFKHAGAKLEFGGPIPKPQLFPGVFLENVNFAIQLDPTVIRGGGQISVLEIASVRGALLLAFASPGAPYVLTPGDAGPEFAPLAGRRFISTTIALGGDVGINAPVLGRIPLANGALMYSYPDYVYFSGGAQVVVPGFSIRGGLKGEAVIERRLFQADGYIRACVGGFACAGANANVGSKGISACLDVLGWNPGAGYGWGDKFPTIWTGVPGDGCKPSKYWIMIKRATASQADGVSFTVAPGEGVKNVRIGGRGAAPSFVIRNPEGETLSATGVGFKRSRTMGAIRTDEGDNTWIGVKGAGRYTIDPLPGSAPIASMSASRKGFDSDYAARVTGTGRRRTLVYDARRKGGQRVTFAEKGKNVYKILGTSRGGQGRIRFTPGIGPGGVRKIVANATLDGVPIPEQTLARYRAPGVVKTGRPRNVRVRRRGSSLIVTWSPAAGATEYGVAVRQTNGDEKQVRVGGRRRKVRFRNVSREQGGVARVSAFGILRDWGKVRTAAFRRTRRPFTVLQTDRFNENRTARAKAKARARKKAEARRKKRR